MSYFNVGTICLWGLDVVLVVSEEVSFGGFGDTMTYVVSFDDHYTDGRPFWIRSDQIRRLV